MKNNMTKIIVVAVIVGAIAFFAGLKYQENKQSQTRGFDTTAQGNRNGQFQRGGNRAGFRPVSGTIISADSTSITVKLPDNSSKIVMLTAKTAINKATTASKSDLQVNEKVAIFGTENSDGSVTAQNIQLDPMMQMGQRPDVVK